MTVGIVVVSHSARLARGVVELAREMAGEGVPIEAAGGLDEPGDPIGTDAMRVMGAVERVAEGGGEALVLMDLGSAVLSAETALDFLPDEVRARVLLCEAPLVEGAVAAAAAARAGASLAEAADEARRGLAGKRAHLGAGDPAGDGPAADDEGGWEEATATIRDPHGLHARPAAAVVRAVAGLDAEVRVANATTGRGPAPARSLTALSTLGALAGHALTVTARGPQAREALAAVVAAVDDGGGPAPAPAAREAAPAAAPPSGSTVRGVAAAPGRAAGPARPAGSAPEPPAAAGAPEDESASLREAIAATRADLAAARDAAARRAGAEAAQIVDAQALMLDDDALIAAAEAAIGGGEGAARAWDAAVRAAAAAYAALDDPYLRARGADLAEVGRRVLGHLAGAGREDAAQGVLVAADLGAAEAAALDPEAVVAVVTAGGGPTSHPAIIARALGIPYVAGAGPAVLALADGTPLLVDGAAGTVVVDPSPAEREDFERRRAEDARRAEAARARAHEPAVTRDGHRIEVAANAGAPGDAADAVRNGADGIGLLRSEFLFLGRRDAPDEDEQVAAYAEVAALLDGRRLVLRTLDAGADKPLPYLSMPREDNPFLGVRGIRLSLARPELLVAQLRAALRVAADAPLSVMFPMVSEPAELDEALALLSRTRESLAADGLAAGAVEVGTMIEVPAAALSAGALAARCDFLSIGTNDLVQYTMAAERGNGGVARLSDPLHPAVLRLIDRVVRDAAPHACRIAVCGEAASDPIAAPLLVGLGVEELSVAPGRVAATKEAVRAIDRGAARAAADAALTLDDAAAVRAARTTA
ncbi:MAG: phosphoenolpyruvate--protein phosphotransferase [Thermoleophilia bacterium]